MIITKQIKFEAAHVLSDYQGPCSNLHGHSYTGTVIIDSPVDEKTHMVLDFNKISRIIEAYDHATIFSAEPIREPFEKALYDLVLAYHKKCVVIRGGKCTAEDMSLQIASEIKSCLVECDVRVTLRETASSEVDTGWRAV